jgi:hypothetical protein
MSRWTPLREAVREELKQAEHESKDATYIQALREQ